MKTILSISIFCLIILLSGNNSYSAPLNGSYTVGSGGHFPTLDSAARALDSNGINGQVIFRILSGTYNTQTILRHTSGASLANTITFESFTGNPDDVILAGTPSAFSLRGVTCVIIQNLTLGNIGISGLCDQIDIANNKFLNGGISQFSDITFNLTIFNNTGLKGINMSTQGLIFQNLEIMNNTFAGPSGSIYLSSSHNTRIEENILNSLHVDFGTNVKIRNNKIEGNDSGFYAMSVRGCEGGIVFNNFVVAHTNTFEVLFRLNSELFVLNNTFTSDGAVDTTASIFDNPSIVFRNNILINYNGGYAASFTNNADLTSDFNNYYNSQPSHLLLFNGTNYDDLPAFRAATGLDIFTSSVDVSFVAPNNLHLAGASLGDENLVGLPDTSVVIDIDGQPRHSVYPYKGADEADVILPVELTSFNAVTNGNNVSLIWITNSEENNYGFEIERKNIESDWVNIGFVAGNGSSGTAHNYSFIDNGLNTGRYNYRLKQIDFNGNFIYHNLINEIQIGIPQKFALSQNYPNPFNPSTKINYELPNDGKVSLKIFDLSGKEVSSLVNEVQKAGFYSVSFNPSGLSSGVYFYTLTSGNFVSTKSMILVK